MTLPKKWIILHFKHTLKLITVHRHLFKCAAFLKNSTNFIFLQLSTKKNLRLSLKKFLKTCHFQNQTTSKKTTWMYSTWMYIGFEKLISNCKNDLLFQLWKIWLSDVSLQLKVFSENPWSARVILPKKWIILHFKHTLKLITVHRHLFKCAAFLKNSTNFIFLQLSTKKNLRLSLKKFLKTCHFQNQTTSKKTTWMYSTWMYIGFEKLISNCKNDPLFQLWKIWLSDDIKSHAYSFATKS